MRSEWTGVCRDPDVCALSLNNHVAGDGAPVGAGSVSSTEPSQEYQLLGRALALVLPREGTSTCPYVT